MADDDEPGDAEEEVRPGEDVDARVHVDVAPVEDAAAWDDDGGDADVLPEDGAGDCEEEAGAGPDVDPVDEETGGDVDAELGPAEALLEATITEADVAALLDDAAPLDVEDGTDVDPAQVDEGGASETPADDEDEPSSDQAWPAELEPDTAAAPDEEPVPPPPPPEPEGLQAASAPTVTHATARARDACRSIRWFISGTLDG